MIKTFIIKSHALCNLNCSYCYEYNRGNDEWKNVPKILSSEVLARVLAGINAHCERFQVKNPALVFHGGEPLLVGKERFRDYLHQIHDSWEYLVPKISIQTNGLLLDDEFLEIMSQFKVSIGISIDGDGAANARRVTHSGKESFEGVIRGLRLVQNSRHAGLLNGILSVINLESQGDEVINFLLDLNVPSIDLLCDFKSADGFDIDEDAAKLGEWMVRAYKAYVRHENASKCEVRVFDAAIRAVMGLPVDSDWFGNKAPDYCVVDTAGYVTPLDHLKAAGILTEKQHVDPSGEAFSSMMPGSFYQRESGPFALGSECLACRHSVECAGGYVATRHRSKSGFNGPSGYCGGYMRFFDHLKEDLSQTKR